VPELLPTPDTFIPSTHPRCSAGFYTPGRGVESALSRSADPEKFAGSRDEIAVAQFSPSVEAPGFIDHSGLPGIGTAFASRCPIDPGRTRRGWVDQETGT